MRVIGTATLAMTALITGVAAPYLWWQLGNSAWPPVTLCALIAVTCVLRLVTRRR